MDDRIAAELELFQKLSVPQMEAVAAESQVLVDRMMAMANANAVPPDDVALHRTSVEDGETSDAPSPKCTDNDVDPSGEGQGSLNRDRLKAHRTSMLIAVSPSSAEGVDDVVACEPTEQSTTPTGDDQRDAAGAKTAPPDMP